MPRPAVLLLLTGAILFVACGSSGSDSQPPGPVATVQVTPASDTLFVAAATQLTAIARDSSGTVVPGASITWSSSNTAIAVVSSTGQVTGVAAGIATITADAGLASDAASLTVQSAGPGTVIVSPGGAAAAVGSVTQLTAVALDSSSTPIPDAVFTWTSSNTSIATVRVGGFVTGVSLGSASITATHTGISGVRSVTIPSTLARGDTALVPVIDVGSATYQGFAGGLYPGGNTMPAAHRAAGITFGQAVAPLNGSGQPSGSGRYVLMSVGYSNTTQEWCADSGTGTCNSWSFTGQALGDPAVRTSGLMILDGAAGGKDVTTWTQPSDANYNRVRDSILAPAGVTERQVQVIWAKMANKNPTTTLPRASSDALSIEAQMGQVLRALKSRYPNLRQVFFSCRSYGGYDTNTLNPEPFALENGFAVKWLIEAQMRQMASGGTVVDPVAGNLNYSTGVAPWVGWGPYLWANGTIPNSQGLVWPRSDFSVDGIHVSTAGETKVGGLLLNFFKTSPQAKCWFLTSGTCP